MQYLETIRRGEVTGKLTAGCYHVDIYKWHKFGQSEYSPAEVNWSACGSVPAEDAMLYGEMIQKAAWLADMWDGAEVHASSFINRVTYWEDYNREFTWRKTQHAESKAPR